MRRQIGKGPGQYWLWTRALSGGSLVHDELASGRRLRCLTVVDDFTHEAVAIEVAHSLPAESVGGALDRAASRRGLPATIVCDNGLGFRSRWLDQWAYERGVVLSFIRPGKPVENAFVESFNGAFREECLNEHWFVTLNDARREIETWRIDYNQVRPHSSLGRLTPGEYAREHSPIPSNPVERVA